MRVILLQPATSDRSPVTGTRVGGGQGPERSGKGAHIQGEGGRQHRSRNENGVG